MKTNSPLFSLFILMRNIVIFIIFGLYGISLLVFLNIVANGGLVESYLFERQNALAETIVYASVGLVPVWLFLVFHVHRTTDDGYVSFRKGNKSVKLLHIVTYLGLALFLCFYVIYFSHNL